MAEFRDSIDIAAAPETVFEYLTTNAGMTAWMGQYADLDPTLPRHTAALAYLHERAGESDTAATLYAEAAAKAHTVAERNHLTTKAATLRHRADG